MGEPGRLLGNTILGEGSSAGSLERRRSCEMDVRVAEEAEVDREEEMSSAVR